MIICNMGIKYGTQLRYPEMVFFFFFFFGNARKRVTICFHNFIRGNSRWARYIYNNDDCDGDMIIVIIIIIDTNIPYKTKIIFNP